MLGRIIELGGVCALKARHVPRELHGGHLHAEADAEEGDAVLPGVLDGPDHAAGPAHAEAAGHQDPVAVLEEGGGILVLQVLGLDPLQVHVRLQPVARMVQGLDEALIALLELHVLAHHADAYAALGIADAVQEVLPRAEVRLLLPQAQQPGNLGVQALQVQVRGTS